MKHFKHLTELPKYPTLHHELMKLIATDVIKWDTTSYDMDEFRPHQRHRKGYSEICLNAQVPDSDDIYDGAGNLIFDWSDCTEVEVDGVMVQKPRKLDVPIPEQNFKYLCNQFKGTTFETVYNMLADKYPMLGRVKIMVQQPHYALPWHTDPANRLHYPIKTQDGCLMVVENEVCYMKQDEWWWSETELYHTAVNPTDFDRFHLVVAIS